MGILDSKASKAETKFSLFCHKLIITSSPNSKDNSPTPPLSFLNLKYFRAFSNEQEDEDGKTVYIELHAKVII